MRGLFKALQKDSVLNWSFWATVSIVAITLISIGISYINLPPFIPLYNQLPWGYARLGKTYELFIPPLVVLALLFVNTFVGLRLTEKYPLLARFLFLTIIGLALFTCIFIERLIFATL
ncbi:MAG TPA: hypothetical protein VEW42_03005 [Candidatus Eisenbacteria bacterium]|nr:hypothetical protein [Candidatus Eisenbacteria bacterium]